MTASSLAQGSLIQPDLPEWSFDKLTGFSPDAVILLDAETHILYLNPVAEALFGYALAEVQGRTLDIFLPEAFISTHRHYVASIKSEAGPACRMGKNRNVYGKHRDGHFIPLDISLAYRRWKGQPLTVCIPRDISEQFNYQQFLNESEQRYRSMIDSQNTLVVRVDREGRFVFANQAYCQMFGKQLDELLGCPFTPLVHPDDLAATLEAMQGLEVPPYRITVEQRAMTVKGWRWIAWEDSVIRDPSRNLYEIQGVGTDITERKAADEARIRQTKLLEYRNQFEELLTSMSTRFINLPPSEIGQEIDHVLKKIGEFEQVDRSYVFLIDRQAAEMNNLHEWCAPGVQPQIEQSQHLLIGLFPRLMKKL